jgi:hypothetical protein
MKFYDFRKTITMFNGILMTDFAEGDDAFKASRIKPSAEMVIGCGGAACVSLSADKSCEVVVKFQQTSPTNAALNKLAALQDHMETFIPVAITQADTYRQDGFGTLLGFIEKPADMVRGAKANNTEWKFIFPEGHFVLGDPPFAGSPTALAEALG